MGKAVFGLLETALMTAIEMGKAGAWLSDHLRKSGLPAGSCDYVDLRAVRDCGAAVSDSWDCGEDLPQAKLRLSEYSVKEYLNTQEYALPELKRQEICIRRSANSF